MNAPQGRFEISERQGILILKPLRVDSQSQAALDEKLKNLTAHGHKHLVVDLSAAEFISGVVVGVFLYYKQLLLNRGGCLILAAPEECARRILDKTGLSSALDLRATVDEAVDLAREKLGSGKWQVVEV